MDRLIQDRCLSKRCENARHNQRSANAVHLSDCGKSLPRIRFSGWSGACLEIRLICQLLFDFDSDSACVVDSLQEHFDAVLCEILINCFAAALPVPVIINN